LRLCPGAGEHFYGNEVWQMTVRVRFAPSPTGHLHIGSARTALFNFLFARKHGGKYILRIEDTDTSRNRADAVEGFVDGFKWLGLEWDEGPDVGGEFGPYTCMERLDIYRRYIDRLLEEGKAYYCYCTKEELDRERQEANAQGKVYRYSGKCARLDEETRNRYEREGRPRTIRFRVPEDREIVFRDLIRGEVRFHTKDMGDFVIVKSNGVPLYNLAVTIDDALMKITHVIRGEEHLSNTPAQLLLYDAFGWNPPEFGHLPLILNESGKKLSKRDETVMQFIEQYRESGYLPEAINNYLALLGWSPPGEYAEQEIFSMDELIRLFSFDRVSKAGAIFDPEKLKWMNGEYIKKLDVKTLTEMALPYLQEHYGIDELDREWAEQLVALYQPSLSHLEELPRQAELFFRDDVRHDEEAREVLNQPSVPSVLPAFRAKVAEAEDAEFQPANIKKMLKGIQKETGYRGKQLFMPIRAAVTGQTHGPDLNQTLSLLGREKVIRRIEQVLEQFLNA
jgi:nondiscriminating glutamyl-tRNA synthetase